MTSDDYRPVSCATHSEYELAIMHKQQLRITCKDESGNLVTEELLPVDIITRDRAEYLVVTDQDCIHKEVRLDKIIEAHPDNNL